MDASAQNLNPFCISKLKRRRRVNPKQPRFRAAGIAPAMRRGAFEIEAIASLQAVVLAVAQPNFKSATENVEEFLAFVGIGFAATASGFNAEEMRLHRGIPPSEELHAHAGVSFQNFSLLGTNEPEIFSGRFEERK